MITYCSTLTQNELQQILELQKQNLPQNLSLEEKEKEGFVTVYHTFAILKKMHDKVPHIIAKYNDKVIAYALCMHPDFGDSIPILKPLFIEIEKYIGATMSYVVMGQICVDKKYRKQGVFRKLYETMQGTLKGYFDTIITEIDSKNIRSLNAHAAIGFNDLCEYSSSGQNWKVVTLDV